MTDNVAILEGYTKKIRARNIARELFLLVKPETDLTGIFRAWDTDKQEFVRIDGYQWRFESANA
jgi:hypothetical protein